ncbi:G protein signaling modulator 2, like isoform X3 [Carassius gibelio]|uniref:G protein signaling modulator 2, like isoform X3 n=1 Tax=Carassius gibelio TaxID=101364 RepID=UPI0022798E88|nr:G protein signaling modulator 2, like isoform X3 [Carassius gibelio]
MCLRGWKPWVSCITLWRTKHVYHTGGKKCMKKIKMFRRCSESPKTKKEKRMEASCLELALEGERLCKVGDYHVGVSFFESAIQVGTEDLQILSAIYSQLGNAYFHLHEYNKALEYHRHDLTLTRTIGDQLGEAKASGNLGNTLKVLGRYDEAAVCCQRHLDISRMLHDKVGQARALYNYGNVYHAKGKNICWSGMDPGEFPEEARIALKKATEYYEANLAIVKELGDRAAQGRTYGNLGNSHYLLGNFQDAVLAHEQRLLIAKEFGDRAAERRAYCNLGNAYIFLGKFDDAAEHYKRTLQLARQLKDRAVEAQACYSLGNTYTLLRDYERAIDYHLKHLIIAQDLKDRIGEGRACWSLGNAYTALGNHEQAMSFSEKHLEISKEIGDRSGELTARMNVSDLQLVLGLKQNNSTTNSSAFIESPTGDSSLPDGRSRGSRRHSMENMELMKLSSDKNMCQDSDLHIKSFADKSVASSVQDQAFEESTTPQQTKSPTKSSIAKTSSKLFFINRFRSKKHRPNGSNSSPPAENHSTSSPPSARPNKQYPPDTLGDDGFFDLLSRFQGSRMDDQRCSLQESLSRVPAASVPCESPPVASNKPISTSGAEASAQPGHFLDLLASSQSRRLDEQRASVDSLPGLRLDQRHSQDVLSKLMADDKEPDEDFFDMLIQCQGSRLDDQRCAPPPPPTRGPTVPDEDFFSLILRSQAKQIDEQRVILPTDTRPLQSNPD